MGGLTAFLSLQKANREVGKSSHEDIEKTIDSSLDIVQHRGPDTRGKWVSQDQRVGRYTGRLRTILSTNQRLGFGQVQLPIVDLTPGGHQPFHDSRDQIHAVVNGELYGYEGYRAALAGEYEFKGHSDCEIVIALYQQYGISFLSHLRGEFALILWDARRELFFAARDRYGVKSLYHTFVNGRLLVATEMKSFLAFGWQPEWCVRNIRDRSWNHDSETYFNGVYKVRR